VLVHGRISAESDTSMLRREWKSALNASLSDRGYRALTDADVRLAWYADALDPTLEGCVRKSEDEAGLDAFGFLLSAIVNSIPSGEARDAKLFANDVMFVLDESRRCAAQRRVGREIERAIATGRPVVILAYSLGSVVTYQYLQKREARATDPRDPKIDLVTIGSPLGVPGLRAMLGIAADSLTKPAAVRSWMNIHDPNDPVAGPVLWGAKVPGITDVPVNRSGSADAHLIEHYLRDRATAETLGRLLNPGTTIRP
jgi:hypothetical protein